ncbi:hypothetical protein D9M73_109590 [compost metagenome]
MSRPAAIEAAPDAMSNRPPSMSRPAARLRLPFPKESIAGPVAVEAVEIEVSSATVRLETSRPARIDTSPPANAPTPEVKSRGAIPISTPAEVMLPTLQSWLGCPTVPVIEVLVPELAPV